MSTKATFILCLVLFAGFVAFSVTKKGPLLTKEELWLGLHQPSSYGKIMLFWKPSVSTDVQGYRVYRGTQSGGPYQALIRSGWLIKGNVHYYEDMTIKVNQKYYYVITSINNKGVESDYSKEVEAEKK